MQGRRLTVTAFALLCFHLTDSDDYSVPLIISTEQAPAEQNGVEEFISFGSEPAEDEQRAGLPDAEGNQPTTSGRVETPWKGGSRRILSPLIRLHNGKSAKPSCCLKQITQIRCQIQTSLVSAELACCRGAEQMLPQIGAKMCWSLIHGPHSCQL